MPLDTEDGAKALQLITSRYDAREWRKKIEKTLSLPPKGMEDDVQRKIFLALCLIVRALSLKIPTQLPFQSGAT